MEPKQQPTLKDELLRIKRKQKELEERLISLEKNSKINNSPSMIGGNYVSYGGGIPQIQKGMINVQEIMAKK